MRRLVFIFAFIGIAVLGAWSALGTSVVAQEGDSSPTVCIAPEIAAAAQAACGDLAVGEACYGAGEVALRDGIALVTGLESAGDRVPLSAFSSVNGTDALLFMRTDDALLTLYGAATLIEDAPDNTAAPPPQITVTNASNLPLNIRNAPGTFGGLVTTLGRGDSLTALGRSPDGAWLLVALENGSTAWIAASVVSTDGDPSTLFTVENADDVTLTAPVIPSFSLEVGDGCGGVLLHRNGTSRSTAHIKINDTDVSFQTATLAFMVDQAALNVSVIDGATEIAWGDTVASYRAGDRVMVSADGVTLSPLADTPTDAPLSALPESVAVCLAPDGSRPAACVPSVVENTAVPPETVMSTAVPPVSQAPANVSYAHQFLPQGQSIWQAHTGADHISGVCETPPIAACDHLSAVVTNPNGTIGWRGQEPVYYPMTPIGADQFYFSGRNSLNNATITMNFTFTGGAWSGTMQYVFDSDPDCTHTFYYTAEFLR